MPVYKNVKEVDGFKIGDEIIIHKPVHTEESPCWIPDMNIYDGLVSIITEMDSGKDRNAVRTRDTGRYRFNTKWIEHVEEDVELEDEELTSFIGGFASHG